MVIFPSCKINLGLSVTEKRGDGFHNLETILFPVPLRDALEILPGQREFLFTSSGIEVGDDAEKNLVVKAYRMMEGQFRIGPVRIHLHKAIPAGAGLGGGSSDAAGTIALLNSLFGLGLQRPEMEDLARELGSDCAFFIGGEPSLAFGKGDRLRPVHLDLDNYRILLVKPPLHISTAEAYGWIAPAAGPGSLEEVINLPPEEWEGKMVNDFEGPVFRRHPLLADIKARMGRAGASFSAMTGSGSAIFGLFRKDRRVPGRNEFGGCFYWHS